MKFVNQIEARKGDFMKSYEDKEQCLKEGELIERTLSDVKRRLGVKRELVYTFVPGKHGSTDGTWQIFLTPA